MRHNQDIMLLTSRNPFYSEQLEKAGFRIFSHAIPVSEMDLGEIRKYPADRTVVFEMHGSDCSSLLVALGRFDKKICITSALTDLMKRTLLDYGIADLLKSPVPGRLVQYISMLHQEEGERSGSMVILDDDLNRKSILGTILSRFNHSAHFVSTVDELMVHMNRQDIAFIAISLGCPSLDIMKLIRSFAGSAVLKRIPFLAYRDLQRGIFIHELLSGVKRLTPYILSPEELYGFLVEMLYRKEIMPHISGLYRFSCDESIDFTGVTLNRIYHEHRDRLFQLKSLLEDETVDAAEMHVDSLKKSLIKADGFRWLNVRREEPSKITCGLGALT